MSKIPKKMLIDTSHDEEVRVAVLDGKGQLEELDFETSTKRTLKGNIYLAKIMRVEPSLQAAFIEYGGNRHGFLPFSEIHPDYFRIPIDDRNKIEQEIMASAETDQDEDLSDTPSLQSLKVQEVKVSSDLNQQDTSTPSKSVSSTPKTSIEPLEAEIIDIEQSPMPEGEVPLQTSYSVAVPEYEVQNTNIERLREEPVETEVESIGGEGTEEFQAKRRRRLSFHDRYKIQEVIHKGQIILIQVAKEERKAKGAALTTYLSFAGRYCVLMPNSPRSGGVSRRISNPVERRKLKDTLRTLSVPDSMSLIIRTAGRGLNKAEIKRDYEYLLRLWSRIREVTLESVAPALIYEEASLIKRAIRDLYNKDIEEIWIQGDDTYQSTKQLFKELMPAHEKRVKLYSQKEIPLFQKFGVESQVENLHKPEVPLPSGGSIVFNQTEALVAIDINSGKATRERHIEKTALNTNMEAAKEIAHQLRLRDLAGLVVIDFIDMEQPENIKIVENQLRSAMSSDRARIQVGHISPFGLLELSRQRLRPSIIEITSVQCRHCHGTGMMRSMESHAMDLLHTIEGIAIKGRHEIISIMAPAEITNYLLNYKRQELSTLEQYHKVRIFLEPNFEMLPPTYELLTDELTPASRKAAQKKQAKANLSIHKERLQQRQQAPVRGHELDDMTAVSAGEEEETGREPQQGSRESYEDRGQRRRGRRGGRRRPQSGPHRQNYGQQNQAPAPAPKDDNSKKSWWQRLLES